MGSLTLLTHKTRPIESFLSYSSLFQKIPNSLVTFSRYYFLFLQKKTNRTIWQLKRTATNRQRQKERKNCAENFIQSKHVRRCWIENLYWLWTVVAIAAVRAVWFVVMCLCVSVSICKRWNAEGEIQPNRYISIAFTCQRQRFHSNSSKEHKQKHIENEEWKRQTPISLKE